MIATAGRAGRPVTVMSAAAVMTVALLLAGCADRAAPGSPSGSTTAGPAASGGPSSGATADPGTLPSSLESSVADADALLEQADALLGQLEKDFQEDAAATG